MADEKETVADIVAELRRDYKGRTPINRAETTHCRRLIADRIEAAWKRECIEIATRSTMEGVRLTNEKFANTPVGNAAKLREALKDTEDLLEHFAKSGSLFADAFALHMRDNRDRPLSRNTLRRVAVGMSKYNGMDFLMDMLGSNGDDNSRVHPLTKPMPTQHSGGNRCAVVRPFIVKLKKNCGAEDIDSPLSTATTKESHALCQPFIVKLNNHADAESVEKPLTSVLVRGQHHALCQPIILDHFKSGEAKSIDEPIGAQTTHDRFSMVTPYLITVQANNAPRGIDKPLRAQTTVRKDYLCTPLVLGQQGGAACRPIDEPCPTIATAGAIRMATPLILDMSRPGGHDSGHVRPADKPIQTLTTCDNVQVAIPVIFDEAVGLPRLPDGRYIDIRLRMLKPSELASAHSFPKDYVLTGTRTDQVKQIGNSVPVKTAAAMCESALRQLAHGRVA